MLGDRAEYPEKHGDSGRDNQQGYHDVAGLTDREDQGESASHGVNADFGQQATEQRGHRHWGGVVGVG